MTRAVVCRGKAEDGTPCGNATTDPSRRCPLHPDRGFGARFSHPPPRSNPRVYASRRWRALRRQVIDEWVREHGWLCPGWRVPAHPSRDLVADHVVPLVAGGAPFARANLAVLCRGCNSRKSLRDRQGWGQTPSAPSR